MVAFIPGFQQVFSSIKLEMFHNGFHSLGWDRVLDLLYVVATGQIGASNKKKKLSYEQLVCRFFTGPPSDRSSSPGGQCHCGLQCNCGTLGGAKSVGLVREVRSSLSWVEFDFPANFCNTHFRGGKLADRFSLQTSEPRGMFFVSRGFQGHMSALVHPVSLLLSWCGKGPHQG